MPEEFVDQREFFESVTYSPFPMPVFFLDRPLRRDVWCYFNEPALRKTFMFAVDETSKIPEMVPSGKSIVTGWSGHPMTLDLIDRPDDEVIGTAQQDIELMIPGFSGYIEEATVFRHPYGVARYPTGSYRQVLDFKKQAEKLRGVSFVSDLFGGSYMEPAMSSAAEAVKRVCQWGGTA
jgi:protoporphyrinogen oxidase